MDTKTINGTATFCDNGKFAFTPDKLSTETELGFEIKNQRGSINIDNDGTTEFEPSEKITVLPPSIDDLLRDKNLIVKRSSRNFIIQMKFPIIENSDLTKKTHRNMWKKVMKVIAAERAIIKNELK